MFCRKSDYTLVIKGSSDKEEKGKISINSFDYSMFIRNTDGKAIEEIFKKAKERR